MQHPATPDGRYFVHRGTLWRRTNPHLAEPVRRALVSDLMAARRAVRSAKASGSRDDLRAARAEVQRCKVALGERGPTWWDDDTDFNRHKVENSPYARWWRERDADAT